MRRYIWTVLFFLIVVDCGSDLYDYGGTITDVKFSDEWEDGHLGTPGNYFAHGTKKIYYQVTFEGEANDGFMIKKVWQIPGRPNLESVSFIPKYAPMIRGEFHYYDTLTDMNAGTYEISLQYYENGTYNDYAYGGGVQRFFTIQ